VGDNQALAARAKVANGVQAFFGHVSTPLHGTARFVLNL